MSKIKTKYVEEDVKDADGITIGYNKVKVTTELVKFIPRSHLATELDRYKKWAAEQNT